MRNKKADPAPLFEDDFFIPIPAEIFNDFEVGRMDLPMWGVYGVLLRQVDFETGIWRGTAYRISAAWNDHLELRTVQRAITRLERGGYIRVFRNPNGHRGGYYVLIHNYKVRFGSLVGHYLDALATTHPTKPEYRKASCTRVSTASRPRQNPVTTASVQTSLPDIPESPERTDDDTSQAQRASEAARSLSVRPLQAAKEAFSILCKDMASEILAYQMILWVLYGAARTRTIPQDANYYVTAHRNFEAQHDFGGETILDNAVDRFEAHAASLLAERAPELLAWLRRLCAELEAQYSSEVEALCNAEKADPAAADEDIPF